jgi:hypothetical protein
MTQQSMQAASIPNPALQPFGILIGTWNTTGTHGLVPDTILHGRTSFEWLEHGELSKDGVSWEKDLDLTYTRVK